MNATLRSALVAIVLASATFCAQAAPLTWNLNGVTFEDGATASGWFVWDASAGTAGAFSITTTSGILTPFTYDTTTSHFDSADWFFPHSLAWIDNGFGRYIDLVFSAALTDGGGSVALTPGGYFAGGSWECNNCDPYRAITAGYVSAQSVPEPASLALLGLGLAGLALGRRR